MDPSFSFSSEGRVFELIPMGPAAGVCRPRFRPKDLRPGCLQRRLQRRVKIDEDARFKGQHAEKCAQEGAWVKVHTTPPAGLVDLVWDIR